jgi:hypothetical protein
MPRPNFLYTFATFPAEGLADLDSSFAGLPLDPYIEGKFRLRRFSHFTGPADRLVRLKHTAFYQSQAVNRYLGGVKREYAELEDALIALPAFRALIAEYHEFLRLDPATTELGVHQIRIRCTPDQVGDPAPEGIHQDGFDYVGIFCVARDNLVGATTELYRPKDAPPIFRRELSPGEAVFVNDREVFHYTDPVRPRAGGEGHRDVFVITADRAKP